MYIIDVDNMFVRILVTIPIAVVNHNVLFIILTHLRKLKFYYSSVVFLFCVFFVQLNFLTAYIIYLYLIEKLN